MNNKQLKDNRYFAERHPKWNLTLGVILISALAGLAGYVAFEILYYIGVGIYKIITLLSTMASKLDAVVIVALITGTVSIISVIISSIISKSLEHKKSKREYLAQKREEPYGEFVNMVYKLQQSAKNPNSYTNEQMITDISRFSKQITLWGSPKVVRKWVKFRENGANPKTAQENLFLLESIMNEMRKDLGLRKVKKGNLLAFFINDIKDAMKNSKK
ncbi:MAG: hypothetical protein IJF54_05205 [Clostridia bacterium]|nr:hypothetical protein [Clostridia bacterium]